VTDEGCAAEIGAFAIESRQHPSSDLRSREGHLPPQGGKGARPPNKNLEFPCFAQENRKSADICLGGLLKTLGNFFRPPNFQKLLFGGFWEYQRLVGKKVWKLRVLRETLPGYVEFRIVSCVVVLSFRMILAGAPGTAFFWVPATQCQIFE
jgi:hypothetical protein